MMPNDSRAEEAKDLYDLALKLRVAVLYSVAESLATHFPPPQEPSPELRAILKRIEDDNVDSGTLLL
jgi:hypothetical protein